MGDRRVKRRKWGGRGHEGEEGSGRSSETSYLAVHDFSHCTVSNKVQQL